MRAAELGAFVRSRRERLHPDDVGLPDSSRRRGAGLRREDLAVLAGIGVSWLTRIEQGGARRISDEVLAGLAQALQLSAAERTHLFSLAGSHAAPVPDTRGAMESYQALVAALEPNPAYVLDDAWNMVVWNRAEEVLFPPLAELAGRGETANLLRLVYGAPSARLLIIDWDAEAARLAHQFRLQLSQYPTDAGHELVDALRAEHPEFARAWDDRDVESFTTTRRLFDHPVDGRLEVDHHRLSLLDHPGWQVVAFIPTPTDEGLDRTK